MRRLLKLVWRMVVAVSLLTLLAVVWFIAGGPLYVDEWLDATEPPVPSAAIVVLGGGSARNLPLPQGWDRITAAAHLYTDQMAPVVIFSGGGTEGVSEAEIYAHAAAWLGIPRAAMIFESDAQTTGDHGFAMLKIVLPDGTPITTSTPLLVVTSRSHSRRALYAFARAGFTKVRVVSAHTATRPSAPGSPGALQSTVATHRPSGRRYDDVLFRSAYRAFDLFIGLREVGAIAAMSR